MDFDEREINYLRNAVDLFNAQIRATAGGRPYAATTIATGERLLARLWAYMPRRGGDDAEDGDADDRDPGRPAGR